MRRKFLFAGGSLAAMFCAIMASAQSSTETYTYDALGRLVRVATAGGTNNGEQRDLAYDPAGNRTSYAACTGSCGPTPSPTPTPTPTPAPTPTPTPTVAITDSNLNVLAAHRPTYECVSEILFGSTFSYCYLNGSGVEVYRSLPSPTFDPGYSMPLPKQLVVTTSAYGTGVAP